MSGGQNVPWGSSQYGAPSSVNLLTDPTKIDVPGIDQEIQQVRTNAGAQQGSANNAAMGALQRSGVAGGSEAGNVLGNIAGQTAAGTGQALAGLQNQQFQEQAGLMDAINQANLYKYGLESKNDMANTQNRYGQDQQIGSEAGSLVGTILKAIGTM